METGNVLESFGTLSHHPNTVWKYPLDNSVELLDESCNSGMENNLNKPLTSVRPFQTTWLNVLTFSFDYRALIGSVYTSMVYQPTNIFLPCCFFSKRTQECMSKYPRSTWIRKYLLPFNEILNLLIILILAIKTSKISWQFIFTTNVCFTSTDFFNSKSSSVFL